MKPTMLCRPRVIHPLVGFMADLSLSQLPAELDFLWLPIRSRNHTGPFVSSLIGVFATLDQSRAAVPSFQIILDKSAH